MLRRTTAGKKRGFHALIESSLKFARERKLINECSEHVAIDSTGYEAGHTSTYYGQRCGLKKSTYPKLTAICDTKSYLYLCAVANRGPFPDHREFPVAVRAAYRAQPFDTFLADAGYDSEAAHVLIREELGRDKRYSTNSRQTDTTGK